MHIYKTFILAFVTLAGLGGTAVGQAPAWVEQGPGPILNGGEEGMSAGAGLPNPVAGAINAIAPSPISADIVFVGTVSGASG